MIYRFCLAGLLFITLSGFSQNAKVTNSSCDNADFENGDLTNWTIATGYPSDDGTTFGWTPGPIKDHITNIQNGDSITSSGYDPIVGGTLLPKVCPGGNFSFLLGNRIPGATNSNYGIISPTSGTTVYGDASRITYTTLITKNNTSLCIKYAIVIDASTFGHMVGQYPYFKINLYNQNGDTIYCGEYNILANGSIFLGTGGQVIPNTSTLWKNWSKYYVDLSNYIGQTIRIEFIAADCTQGGHLAYAYIDASCEAPVISIASQSCDSIQLVGPESIKGYHWSGPGINGATNTKNISVFKSGKYSLMLDSTGTGCGIMLDTTISFPGPIASFNYANTSATTILFSDSSATTCANDTIQTYAWNFGDGQTSTLSDPTHAYSSAGAYTVILTVHSKNGGVDSVTKNIVISTSTSINENAGINNLSYYTDPNSETHIVFSTLKDQRIILELYDMLGQVIQKKELYLSKGKNDLLLNTLAIPAGLYIVSLQKQNFISVVIEK